MIQADTTELEKSLLEYKLEVERKLKHMVAGFAREVAESASNQTKLGDPVRYASWYKRRAEGPLHIEAKAGFHKGAWAYTEGELNFDNTIYPVGVMANEVQYAAQTEYKVGDRFTIGATGPAYGMLQSRDDIMGDAEAAIHRAYLSNLKHYYDEG